jgi:hypothetical protein
VPWRSTSNLTVSLSTFLFHPHPSAFVRLTRHQALSQGRGRTISYQSCPNLRDLYIADDKQPVTHRDTLSRSLIGFFNFQNLTDLLRSLSISPNAQCLMPNAFPHQTIKIYLYLTDPLKRICVKSCRIMKDNSQRKPSSRL